VESIKGAIVFNKMGDLVNSGIVKGRVKCHADEWSGMLDFKDAEQKAVQDVLIEAQTKDFETGEMKQWRLQVCNGSGDTARMTVNEGRIMVDHAEAELRRLNVAILKLHGGKFAKGESTVFSYCPCCIDSATIKSAKTEHTDFSLQAPSISKVANTKKCSYASMMHDPKQLSFISVKSSAANSVEVVVHPAVYFKDMLSNNAPPSMIVANAAHSNCQWLVCSFRSCCSFHN
jgi:hypothetical protein